MFQSFQLTYHARTTFRSVQDEDGDEDEDEGEDDNEDDNEDGDLM